MKKLYVPAIGGLIAVVFLALHGAGAAPTGPGQPTNLEVAAVTENSITLVWGPSQPGTFSISAATKTSATLVWGPSSDTRGAVTYNVEKDGTQIASGILSPQYKFTGLNPKTNSFRVCIKAVNPRGQVSPASCGTVSRNTQVV